MVGLGDHLPGFIAMSFDERRGGPARDFAEKETVEPVPTEAEIPAEAETAEEAPKPKRRRSRAKKADSPAQADSDTAEPSGTQEADVPDAAGGNEPAENDSADTAA